MQAPQYQPGQMQSPQGADREPFVTPNDNGGIAGGLARGGQALAQGIEQYAEAEDAIQTHYDETQARRLALEYQQKAQAVVSEYSALQGENAIEAAQPTLDQLEELRSSYTDRAGNQRMAAMLGERIDPLAMRAGGSVSTHSIGEQTTLDIETTTAEMALATQNASTSYEDPALMAEYMADARAASERLGRLNGWSAETREAHVLGVVSNIHNQVMTDLLSGPDPDIEFAVGYYEANQDDMTSAHRASAERALSGPLEQIQTNQDWDMLMGSMFGEMVEDVQSSEASEEPQMAQRTTPVQGARITDDFHDHARRGSAGLDLAAPAGTAIVAAAEGEVIEAGTGRTGGNFIRVRHPDGSVSSYMHMQSRPQFEVGDRVTPTTVLGTVGMTGNASGPHLHMEVKNSEGQQVDPEEWLSGSSPIGTVTQARNWDRGELNAAIDRMIDSGDISVARGERLRSHAMRRVDMDEAALRENETDALRQATEWYVENQDFTDFNQMPEEVRNNLAPGDVLRFQGIAQQNAQPDPIATNGPTYLNLQGLRMDNPELFASTNLGNFAGMVSPGELARMIQQQNSIREDGNDWNPSPGINRVFNRFEMLNNTEYSDDEERGIKLIMEERLIQRNIQSQGRGLTDQDYEDAYRYATESVSVPDPGFFWDGTQDVPRYDLPDAVGSATQRVASGRSRMRDMADQRSQAIRIYQEANNGVLPTEAEIRDLVRRMNGN